MLWLAVEMERGIRAIVRIFDMYVYGKLKFARLQRSRLACLYARIGVGRAHIAC